MEPNVAAADPARSPSTISARVHQRLAALRVSMPGPGFAWMLTANATYSFCQWAFIIVLAKIGSPEHVGGYALALAVTAPVLVLANCQGRNLVASDVAEEYSFGEYLAFRLTLFAVAFATICMLALAQTSWTIRSAILLLGLAQVCEWTGETYLGLFQKRDRLDRVSQSLAMKAILSLAFLSAAMYTTRSLVWAVAGIAAGRALVLLFFDARVGSRLAGHFRLHCSWARLGSLLLRAAPLGVISGLVAFNLNIPRYFVQSNLGSRELGIFSAIASLISAGNLIMAALASCSFVPLARAHLMGDRRAYRSLALQLCGMGAALAAVGVFVAVFGGRFVLSVLFRPEYGDSAGVFSRLMVVGGIGYIVSGQGYTMTAARKFLPQIPLLICTGLILAAASWYLIPRRGIEGAAEAWMIGAVAQLAGGTAIMMRMGRSAPSIVPASQSAAGGR